MRIAFFTYSEWAFGAVHNALCKELYKFEIYSNIIDWNKSYNEEEIDSFRELYDVFVTVPGGPVNVLLNYGIPYDNIIAIAHGRFDIQSGIEQGNDFNAFLKFGGVSPDLQRYAKKKGISRDMQVALNGIHFDYFYREPASQLNMLGYSGALEYINHLDGNKDLKRGHLVKSVADRCGLPVKLVSRRSYLAMPTYYRDVDCVLVSSTEESCGLPLMESAAAGRISLSTPVGVSRDYDNSPNIVLPFDENKYIDAASNMIAYLHKDTAIFKKMCKTAQDFARQNYDWSVRIGDWIKLLT